MPAVAATSRQATPSQAYGVLHPIAQPTTSPNRKDCSPRPKHEKQENYTLWEGPGDCTTALRACQLEEARRRAPVGQTKFCQEEVRALLRQLMPGLQGSVGSALAAREPGALKAGRGLVRILFQ